jgi:hypothetical protein
MKTQKELEERLAEIEADERLHYPVSTIQANAPLALIQTELHKEANTLRWVLELPYRRYHSRSEENSVQPNETCDYCGLYLEGGREMAGNLCHCSRCLNCEALMGDTSDHYCDSCSKEAETPEEIRE